MDAVCTSAMRLVSASLDVLAVQEEDGTPLHIMPSDHPSIDDVSQPPLSASCYTDKALILAMTPYEKSYTLELRTFFLHSSEVNPAPHQLLFPAPLLPGVQILSTDDDTIILQACTSTGYAYRAHLPLSLLHSVDDIPSRWFVEQRLSSVSSEARTVQRERSLTSLHCSQDGQIMLVSYSDGRVAKLAWEESGSSGALDGRWRESILRPSTFFGRLFGRGGTSSSPSHVLSMATYPRSSSWTGTLGFTVSQDRRLRVWDLGSDACIRTIDLPRVLARSESDAFEQDLALSEAQAQSNNTSGDDSPVSYSRPALIRTLSIAHSDSSSPYALYLVVFVPASAPSGPFLACYGVQLEAVSSSSSRQFAGSVGDIDLLWERRCDHDVSGSDVEIRDMSITFGGGHWDVWCVWDAAGKTLVKTTRVQDPSTASSDASGEDWRSISLPLSYSPLHGTALDEDLEGLDEASELGAFFMDRITEPGRFNLSSLDDAVKAYEKVLLTRQEDPVHLPLMDFSQNNIREQILGLVGCTVHLGQDEATGAPLHDAFFAALRREWAIFIGLLFQFDGRERWPISFAEGPERAKREQDPPFVVSRGWLSLPVLEDQASFLLRQSKSLANTHEDNKAINLIRFANRLKGCIHPRALRDFESGLIDILASQPSIVIEDAADELWSANVVETITEDDESLLEDFILVEEDLQSTLGSILSHLTKPSEGGHSTSQTSLTELTAALCSDTLTQIVSDRLAVAQLLLLVSVSVNNGFFEHTENVVEEGTMSDIVRQSIVAFHSLYAFDMASHFDGVAEMTFNEPQLDEDAMDADAVAKRMRQMQFDTPREQKSTQVDASAVNLIHKELLQGSLRGGLIASVSWSSAITYMAANALHTFLFDNDDVATVELSLPALYFANQALLHGHPSAAMSFVKLFPSTPAGDYIVARSLLALGDIEDAADTFEKILPIFEHWDEERSTLGCGILDLLPLNIREADLPTEAAFLFCRLAVLHFRKARCLPQVSHFAKLAIIRSASASSDFLGKRRELHLALFRSCIELDEFDDAYVHLLANPFDDLQRESLRTLISIMCERGFVEQLLSYNFAGLQVEVERTLSFKARNSDPLSDGANYYEILYAFHVRRGDLKSAGATMWQMGMRINDFYRRRVVQTRKAHANAGIKAGYDESEQTELRQFAVHEARCYLASVNALSLIDVKDAWFAHELSQTAEDHLAEAAKLTSYIPAKSFHKRTRDICIISLEDVRRRYQLLLAQLELVSLYPEESTSIMMSNSSDAASAVLLFVRNQDFEHAFALAHSTNVDRAQLYANLTDKCLELARWDEIRQQRSREQDGQDEHPLMRAMYDDQDMATYGPAGFGLDGAVDNYPHPPSARFLDRSDRCVSWKGSPSERAWRYLRLWLGLEESGEQSGSDNGAAARYQLAVLSRIVERQMWRLAPRWLLDWQRENQPDSLIRVLMDHDLFMPAMQEATEMVRSSTKQATTSIKRRRVGNGFAGSTYLPYLLIDELLKRAEGLDMSSTTTADSPAEVATQQASLTERRQAAKVLREAIETRKEQLHKLEIEIRRNIDEDEARQRRLTSNRQRQGVDVDMTG